MTNFVQNLVLNFATIFVPPMLYATAYTVGGRDTAPVFRPRIWRRLIAPLLLSTSLLAMTYVTGKLYSINAICHILSSFITYFLAMMLTKYGGDTLEQKIKGRVWSGLCAGVASLPIAMYAGSWKLFVAQVILAISAHLALGIKNILKAPTEEFLISLLTTLLVGWMIIQRITHAG